MINGTITFKAIKAYEDYQKKNSKPDNHALTKEIFTSLAGTTINCLVETKDLDTLEAAKAKHYAKKETEALYTSKYE
ncbi:hypothetical protein BC938DRAFT_479049 [Jimgerdemannia flammicorona]|uniref:Uncharacterized protein n=1 Tax=Jimgerdemannia flammicorona TaxID=994334 RepID=A0A433QLQ8_9FUNG|nr:hypothetical protein BC938DRAFT_479049 [Jimgerdemannia flammicorona]